MIIEISKFHKNHYGLLEGWWREREFPAPPPELLPRRGAVVSIDGVETCAGFLTFTDASCAVICHLVSNPKTSGEARNEGLDYLLSYLIEIARKFGFKAVFASCAENLPKLHERFLRHELSMTDKNINCYGRIF